MNTIINTSIITDYSGEPPIVTYSNPVTTVIRQTPPTPVITRIFYRNICGCCDGCNTCNNCCNNWRSNSCCGCSNNCRCSSSCGCNENF